MNIRFGFGTDLNFKVIMKGIRISYWHGRHEGGGDRNHRPGKGERSEGEHPVNKDNVEQPKAEIKKPKEQQGKTGVEKPKPEKEKDDSKPKGE
jgi:hypothetical protein